MEGSGGNGQGFGDSLSRYGGIVFRQVIQRHPARQFIENLFDGDAYSLDCGFARDDVRLLFTSVSAKHCILYRFIQ